MSCSAGLLTYARLPRFTANKVCRVGQDGPEEDLAGERRKDDQAEGHYYLHTLSHRFLMRARVSRSPLYHTRPSLWITLPSPHVRTSYTANPRPTPEMSLFAYLP